MPEPMKVVSSGARGWPEPFEPLRCRHYLSLLALGGMLHSSSVQSAYADVPKVAWADFLADAISELAGGRSQGLLWSHKAVCGFLADVGVRVTSGGPPLISLLVDRIQAVSASEIQDWQKANELELLRRENEQLKRQLENASKRSAG